MMTRLIVLIALALAAGLALSGVRQSAEAVARHWGLVTVDSTDDAGWSTSIAVSAQGHALVSYLDNTAKNLKFAICDLTASACAEGNAWSPMTVDSGVTVEPHTSIAVGAAEDVWVSYYDYSNTNLKLATCSIAASGCDEPSDWSTCTADSGGTNGGYSSIALDGTGQALISYYNWDGMDLMFTVCDEACNCPTKVTVDNGDYVGDTTSIGLTGDGNPIIAYIDDGLDNLNVAICYDMLGSGCDEVSDWIHYAIDEDGVMAFGISLAFDTDGFPIVSYLGEGVYSSDPGKLKFAVCRQDVDSGGCDDPTDWTGKFAIPNALDVWDSSIAVDRYGHPAIAYYDFTGDVRDLKLAVCRDEVEPRCDHPSNWTTETVDWEGEVGGATSLTAAPDGPLLISYHDATKLDLKVAIGALPVGGIAELPEIDGALLETGGSSGPGAGALAVTAAGLAAAAVALGGGAWYVRRRCVR